ncbi:hypothetical protein DL768_005588 [Monosporascus sp. mg162]|nr:hypothetical protein DL768_005588 [Monosporascus sp. mg162]
MDGQQPCPSLVTSKETEASAGSSERLGSEVWAPSVSVRVARAPPRWCEIAVAKSDEGVVTRLDNLGNQLESRYERTGEITDLEEAIGVAREAVESTPHDHPDQAGRLSNLGTKLGRRYERTGETANLEEAIEVARQAVESTPHDHPSETSFISAKGGAKGLDLNIITSIRDVRVQPNAPKHPALDLLDTQKPVRVAIYLRAKSPRFSLSADELVRTTCILLKIPPDRSGLLAIQRWRRLTAFVFDVFHDEYDLSSAHHKVDLPVVLVDYGSRNGSAYVRIASQHFRDFVNRHVARQHNLHGWEARPPFFEDQTAARPPTASDTRSRASTFAPCKMLGTMEARAGRGRSASTACSKSITIARFVSSSQCSPYGASAVGPVRTAATLPREAQRSSRRPKRHGKRGVAHPPSRESTLERDIETDRAPAATFEEWPLRDAVLKRVTMNGSPPNFMLQFTWGPCAEHGAGYRGMENRGTVSSAKRHRPARQESKGSTKDEGKQTSTSRRARYTPADDAKVRHLKEQGLSWIAIAQHFPGRSGSRQLCGHSRALSPVVGDDSGEEEWVVEEICDDRRLDDGGLELLVKWKVERRHGSLMGTWRRRRRLTSMSAFMVRLV